MSEPLLLVANLVKRFEGIVATEILRSMLPPAKCTR